MKKTISLFISKVLLLNLILFSVSCENDDAVDPLFSEAPAIRIANEISELQTLLVAEEQGYSGIYFPNNSSVGGINFHMKFTADQRVLMTSDYKSDTSLTNTRYEVSIGTTAAELVFTSASRHVTDLIQESDPPAPFDSFFGNNVFQYAGQENGTITFQEIRSRGIFVISPSGFADFESESVASADLTFSNRNEFVNNPEATPFQFLTISTSNGLERYDLGYNSETIFATSIGQDDSDNVLNREFGIGFTENGLIVSPPLEVDGELIEEFIFDNTSGYEYVATVNNVTAIIGYSQAPVTSFNNYQIGTDGVAVFNLNERFKSSDDFNTFFDQNNDDLADNFGGLNVTNVILWNLLETDDEPFIQIRTNGFGTYNYGFTFEVDDDNVYTFTLSVNNSANVTPFITSVFQPLLDEFILAGEGYYVQDANSNYLTFPNSTIIFINKAEPNKSFNFWLFTP